MKASFYLTMMLCIPCALGAQLRIQRGAGMTVQGDAKIILHNASFINDGRFEPGNSTIIFAGEDKTNTIFAGGISRTAFLNLTINRPLGEVQLQNDLSIAGNLIMSDGNIELNNHRLDLGATGLIKGEKPGSRITGARGGIITVTTTLDNPVNANPGNIGIALTGNSNFGTLTITRGHVQQINNEGNRSIQRYYDLGINTSGVTVKLSYFEPELAGNSGSGLVLWRLNHQRFTMGPGETSLTVFPNPARDRFTLALYSEAAKETFVNLQDAQGHVLERRQVRLTAGLNTLQWNISKYAAGTYYVGVENSSINNMKIAKQ